MPLLCFQLQYDAQERIFSMRLRPGFPNVNLPFFAKGVLPKKEVEEIQVTHDFRHGIDLLKNLC